ncbi:MAG: thioredoxin-like domain-containing protein [Ignavibacteriales bacterium]|nr:thioredoxin-like domain-containing protein [Ignavibacteriales bacterium]
MKKLFLIIVCLTAINAGAALSQDFRATSDDGRSVVLKKSGIWFFVDKSPPEDGRAVIYDGRAVKLESTGKWSFLNNKEPVPVPTHKLSRSSAATGASSQSSGKSYSGQFLHPFLDENASGLGTSDAQPAERTRLTTKQFVLVFFSGHWCPPCRVFTPQLVQFYNQKGGGEKFEILFISNDRSAREMMSYMAETQMPWLALQWKSEGAGAIEKRFSGPGIPCLVLLNGNDEVLSDSYVGGKYVGPHKVLSDLERILEQ